MIAPFQKQATGGAAKRTVSQAPSALAQRSAKPQAMNGGMDALEEKADRRVDVERRGVSPARKFSFSKVNVLAVQRQCACGNSSGTMGRCEECGQRRALGLQTKLTVNQPGDAYEQEADRVADSMMGCFSRPHAPEAKAGMEHHQPLESELTKGGEQLPPGVAEFYQARFGRDFGHVRVHTGETALRYNDAVNAYAFTYGSHIWLGHGLRPEPSHILAHELAHVVQQTQPPPRAAAPHQPGLSPSPQSVQRYEPYWMPAEFIAEDKSARKKVGTPTHKLVLPRIGEVNRVYTEAPVPNADSKGNVGFDFRGIADIYQASTTVGVYFDKKKLPRELDSNPELKFAGKSLERNGHINNSAPRADEKRQSVIRAGNAPKEILVGDLKPSHGTEEARKGPQQVQDYLKGFELAQTEVNKLSIGEGGIGQTDAKWSPLKTGIISINVPDEFKDSTRGSGQKSRALVQVYNGREVNAPKPVKGKGREFVKGKVYVKESPGKGGIWNCVWEPDTDVKAASARQRDRHGHRGAIETYQSNTLVSCSGREEGQTRPACFAPDKRAPKHSNAAAPRGCDRGGERPIRQGSLRDLEGRSPSSDRQRKTVRKDSRV